MQQCIAHVIAADVQAHQHRLLDLLVWAARWHRSAAPANRQRSLAAAEQEASFYKRTIRLGLTVASSGGAQPVGSRQTRFSVRDHWAQRAKSKQTLQKKHLIAHKDVLANDGVVLQPAPGAQLAAPADDAVCHPRVVLHLALQIRKTALWQCLRWPQAARAVWETAGNR